MTAWRTVTARWYESTPYARPGTFVVVDSTMYVDWHSDELPGRWVLGVYHRSREVLAGAIPLGRNGLAVTLLTSSDHSEWARHRGHMFGRSVELLAEELWELLDDTWKTPPVSLTADTLAVRLGLIDDDPDGVLVCDPTPPQEPPE